MKPLIWLIASLIFLSSHCIAQTLAIRAGEHGDFTRLVVPLPGALDWQLEQAGQGATITFSNGDVTFDLSEVFARISQSRLSGIFPEQNTLRLIFGCNCNAEAFVHDNAFLVVDIQAKANANNNRRPKSRPRVQVTQLESPGSSLVEAPVSRADAAGLMQDRLVAATRIQTNRQALGSEYKARLSATREVLLEHLNRSVSTGMLNLADEPFPAPPISGMQANEPKAVPRLPQIKLQSQATVDRDFKSGFEQQARQAFEIACPTPDLIDLTLWAGEQDFSTQLGILRRDLVDERDRPKKETIDALARFYVHYGFGAEARQLIDSAPDKPQGAAMWLAMIEIMDTGHPAQQSELSKFLHCEGPAGLWAFLSSRPQPRQRVVDANSHLRAFSLMPRHIRSLIGPSLAAQLRIADHQTAADAVLRILERTEPKTLNDTAIAQLQGTPDLEILEPDLKQILRENVASSHTALVRLIDLKLRKGEEISYETAQLVGAYVHERRKLPDHLQLVKAYLTALIASGAYEEGSQELRRLADTLDEAAQAEIRTAMFEVLAARAPTAEVVRYALSQTLGDPRFLPDSTIDKVIEHLSDAGFLEDALRFARLPIKEGIANDRALVTAEIEIQLRRPSAALASLIGHSGRAADLLRGQAFEMARDYDRARTMYLAADEPERAAHAAWMAQNWTQVLEAGREPERQVAVALENLAQSERAKPATDETTLAHSRNLLASSEATRDVMALMLGQIRPPAPIE